jgi:hypothetical protein
MLVASFELVHSLHGIHVETRHRHKVSFFKQTALFLATASFLTLVLYAGASNHRTDDTGGDSMPERLKSVDPLLVPVLICLCTFVTMSEYTFCNLVYVFLDGRVHRMLTTFNMMAVSLACNVAIEYFIIQTMGSSATLYWSKNVGICMAIYLRDAVSDLQKYKNDRVSNRTAEAPADGRRRKHLCPECLAKASR